MNDPILDAIWRDAIDQFQKTTDNPYPFLGSKSSFNINELVKEIETRERLSNQHRDGGPKSDKVFLPNEAVFYGCRMLMDAANTVSSDHEKLAGFFKHVKEYLLDVEDWSEYISAVPKLARALTEIFSSILILSAIQVKYLKINRAVKTWQRLAGEDVELKDAYQNFLHNIQRGRDIVLTTLAINQKKNFKDQKRNFDAVHANQKVLIENFNDQKKDLEKFHADLAMVRADLTQLQQRHTAVERELIRQSAINRQNADEEQILAWVSTFDFRARHRENIRKYHPGTGLWLLESAEFQSWSANLGPSTLWCPGDPGTGKSVLMSAAIDVFEREIKRPNDAIAYVYCDYKDEKSHDASEIWSSIIFQLAKQHRSFPAALEDYHDKFMNSIVLPKAEDQVALIKLLTKEFGNSYVFIDAIDECPEDSRALLLSCVEELSSHLRLFLTSRHSVDVQDELPFDVGRVDVVADKRDVRAFLEDRIQHLHFRKLHSTFKQRPGLKEDIIQTLTEQSNGMFLLAHLQVEQLRGECLPQEIEDVLSAPAKTVHEFYDNSLERIKQQEDEDYQVLALRVLSYIFSARRQLSIDELIHAITVDPTTEDMTREDLHQKFVVLSFSSGLIRVDEATGSVSLTHLTLHEHFQKYPQKLLPDYEKEFSASCLRYMSFEPFSAGPCSTVSDMNNRLQMYCFLEYACQHWAHHAANYLDDEEISRLVYSLFTQVGKRASSVQVLHLPHHHVGQWHDRYPRNFTALHAAAFWGLAQFMEALGGSIGPVDAKDTFDQTPLLLAAKNGHSGIVSRLMKMRADLDIWDGHEATPLSWAARNGHRDTADLLLKNGAELTTEDDEGWTPLHWSIIGDHTDVVKLLLNISTNVESTKSEKNKALILAAETGADAIIQLLLAEGADVDCVDKSGSTPLHWTIPEGHETTTKLLLSKGADPNSRDDCLNVPLHWAIFNYSLTKLLLSHKADPNAQNETGQTPLLWSAQLGRADVVAALIEAGADVNVKDSFEVTALHAAALIGDETGTRLLIKNGADVSALDKDGWTPLHAAVVKGHQPVIDVLLRYTSGGQAIVNQATQWLSNSDHRYLIEAMARRKSSGSTVVSGLRSAVNSGYDQRLLQLLENGAEVDGLDEVGGFPAITHATWMGRDHMVEILLDHGASVDKTERTGYTSLHIAAESGYWELVEMLVQKGAADVNKTVSGWTPMLLAAKLWEPRIVKFLLQNGADANAKDYHGRNALHWMSYHGDKLLSTALIQAGANADEQDHCGQTPLHWAIAGRSPLAVRFLLRQKVRAGLKTRNGYTALHLAAYTGQTDMVDLLLNAKRRLVRRRTLLDMSENTQEAEVVDVLAQDKDGLTALDMAILTGNTNIVRRLQGEPEARGSTLGADGLDPKQAEVISRRMESIPPPALFPKDAESDFCSHNGFKDGLGVLLITEEVRQWLLEQRKIQLGSAQTDLPAGSLALRKAHTTPKAVV